MLMKSAGGRRGTDAPFGPPETLVSSAAGTQLL